MAVSNRKLAPRRHESLRQTGRRPLVGLLVS